LSLKYEATHLILVDALLRKDLMYLELLLFAGFGHGDFGSTYDGAEHEHSRRDEKDCGQNPASCCGVSMCGI